MGELSSHCIPRKAEKIRKVFTPGHSGPHGGEVPWYYTYMEGGRKKQQPPDKRDAVQAHTL